MKFILNSRRFAVIHICKPHKSTHNQSSQISMPARHTLTDRKALAITAVLRYWADEGIETLVHLINLGAYRQLSVPKAQQRKAANRYHQC